MFSGFAIADASLYSGLSDWIGEELRLLSEIPDSLLLLIVVIITSITTEVVSSLAIANILLPIIVPLVSTYLVCMIILDNIFSGLKNDDSIVSVEEFEHSPTLFVRGRCSHLPVCVSVSGKVQKNRTI